MATKQSASRTVGYSFISEQDLQSPTEDLLRKESQRKGTPLTQYDTNGRFLWLNGTPGAPLRKIIAQVLALGWQKN